jgi:5S rRNA maturation endonuclease (ribonuclease M5)
MNIDEKKEHLEELEKTVAELVEINKEVPVIVEGSRDIASLRAIGLTGEILKINTGKTLIYTCDDISKKYKRIVILTDWDRKGGTLARFLRDCFESSGVKPEMEIRAILARLCKKDIKDVESLYRHIESLRDKIRNGINLSGKNALNKQGDIQ